MGGLLSKVVMIGVLIRLIRKVMCYIMLVCGRVNKLFRMLLMFVIWLLNNISMVVVVLMISLLVSDRLGVKFVMLISMFFFFCCWCRIVCIG